MVRRIVALLLALLTAVAPLGCGDTTAPPDGSAPRQKPRTAAQPGLSEPAAHPSPAATDRPTVTDRPTGQPSGTVHRGWTVTVYYTAVAAYHTGPTVRVTGCPRLDCEHGTADLGTYPTSFVTAVKDEGTGRTADGRYLNWSYDTGYWLDTAPRDSAGRPLRAWASAAADRGVLRQGSVFRIVDCGNDGDGGRIDQSVCDRLGAAHWTIVDEFTPGLGGERHVDVYIGEETGPGFKDSPLYTTLEDAWLMVG